jgi:hypothetical protein
MIPDTNADKPNHDKRHWVTIVLKRFDYINWDRFFYNCYGERDELTVFGWIDRDQDSYKDFVVLWFDFKKWKWEVCATSSTKYSNELVQKSGAETHVPCQRVESVFNIENCIKTQNEVSI